MAEQLIQFFFSQLTQSAAQHKELYGKQCNQLKDQDLRDNIWQGVSQLLGYENGRISCG